MIEYKNKKIIFIGPSSYLIGKNKGNFIDSFDIIIRTNNSINMSEKLYNDYGSRTDVLYVNNPYTKACYPFDLKTWKTKGLKEIVLRDNFENILEELNKDIFARTCYKVHVELSDKLSGALMGSYLITDILNKQPKELYIMGIDFYKNSYINNYINMYYLY